MTPTETRTNAIITELEEQRNAAFVRACAHKADLAVAQELYKTAVAERDALLAERDAAREA